MSDVRPMRSSMNSAPYTVDIVSPQYPCGSSWLANALLEMQVLLRHLWSFETAGEWEHDSNGDSRYVAQHLPWGQTLPSLRLDRAFRFRRDVRPRFTHLYPWQLEPCSRIVLMVRDPRDALYSMWQWQQHNEQYPPSIPFVEYLASPFYGGPISIIDMLWLHLRSWLSLRGDESRQVYVLRFEDWKRDPVGELGAVTRWMGLDCDQSVLRRAAVASDVSNLHRIEREVAREIPNARRFHRLGQPEEWRVAWKADWSEALGRHWQPVYRALGYAPPSRTGSTVPAFDLNQVLAWRDLTEPSLVQLWHHRLSTDMMLESDDPVPSGWSATGQHGGLGSRQ